VAVTAPRYRAAFGVADHGGRHSCSDAVPSVPVYDPGRVVGGHSAGVTRSTRCYTVNMSMPEITQRDLRSKSREIMDAVEHGQSFTVTRDGHQIGELIPIRQRRRFVSRQEFTAMSRNAPGNDLDAFRADQDAAADHEDGDPYER
jgi:prevent-host-death family protein